jgi:hypothetical protein
VGPALLDALRTIPTLEKADAALALYSTGKKPTKGEEALMTQKEDEEEAIYDASQLTPPPQRNAASELEDDADLSGDDSGDDSGDEGDDSGDEGNLNTHPHNTHTIHTTHTRHTTHTHGMARV